MIHPTTLQWKRCYREHVLCNWPFYAWNPSVTSNTIFHGFFVVRLDIIFLCCSLCNDHSLVMKYIHTKHTSRIYRQSEYRNCAHCFVQAIVQAFTTAYDGSKEGTLRNEVMSSSINVYCLCVYCHICIAMGYHFLLFVIHALFSHHSHSKSKGIMLIFLNHD